MSPNGEKKQQLSDTLETLVRDLGVHRPTKEQAAIIEYPLTAPAGAETVSAPLLVVAGAGSGKTETMSLRAVYAAAEFGVPEENILGLTFTRKAAAELSSRLNERLAQIKSRNRSVQNIGLLEFEASALSSTYNAFALDVVKEFGSQLGLPTDFAHLDAAASWQLMYDIVDTWRGPLPTTLQPATVADRALSLREDIMNQGMSPSEGKRELGRLQDQFNRTLEERGGKGRFLLEGKEANEIRLVLLELIEEFQARKEILGRYDFADQIAMANRIVEQLPTAREELRRRHSVVFLDEFQDTSVSQMRFLSTLFADHPVTAVGDPNQAIYGWRGASAASLDDFHSLFSTNPGAPRDRLTLSTAWRNPVSVLAVANKIAGPLRDKPAWDPHADTNIPSPMLKAKDEAPPGSVEFSYTESEDQEISKIVEFLRENYLASPGDTSRPTAAVLCRTRRSIQPIIEACRAVGIPAETGSEDGLLLHPAVLDQRAALEIAHDLGRSSQLLRLIANLDLGSEDLWNLGGLARELAQKGAADSRTQPTNSGDRPDTLLIEAVDYLADLPDPAQASDLKSLHKLTPAARSRLAGLGQKLRRIRECSSWEIIDQVENTRRVLGTDAEALALGEAGDITEVLDAFAEAAYDYQESSPDGTMPAFLAWLDVSENKERGLQLPSVEPNPHAVQVMTVHGAKGLEWDLVVVPDLACTRFPLSGGRASVIEKGQEEVPGSAKSPAMPAPDLGWWKSVGELPYPLRKDRRHLPAANVWDSEMKLGEMEAGFREAVGAYKYAEERRLAYVAFTRPMQKLLLTGAWVGTGVTPRYPSPFLLEANRTIEDPSWEPESPPAQRLKALQAGKESAVFPPPPGSVRRRVELSASRVMDELKQLPEGDPDLSTVNELAASLPDQRLVATVKVLLKELEEKTGQNHLTDSQRARSQIMEGRQRPGSFTTTQLAQLGSEKDVWLSLRRPTPARPYAGAAVGTAFHEWVESELRMASAITSDEEPSEASWRGGIADASPPDFARGLDDEQAKHLHRLCDQFTSMNWLQNYDVEGLEVPFAQEVGGLLVRGRIDAVLIEKRTGRTLLVDWKTGTPPDFEAPTPEQLDTLRRYAVQLEIYKSAWEKRLPNGKTDAELVFISARGTKIITLENLKETLGRAGTEPPSIGDVASSWSAQFDNRQSTR